MALKPYGVWGLLDKDLRQLPGYGNPAEEKTKAGKLLAEAGFGPSNPLKIEMVTRAVPTYIDLALSVISELKQVGVDATLKQIESAHWHPLATRRQYQAGPASPFFVALIPMPPVRLTLRRTGGRTV